MTLVSPFTPFNYGSSTLPSSVTLPLLYPSPVSRLVLYSSATNIAQQPSWVVISGISEGSEHVLGSVNHPYLWNNESQPLLIPLDASRPVSSLTVSVYSSNSQTNHAHFYGALEVYSREELFCEAEDGFARTWENQFAVVSLRNQTTKGYMIRFCTVVTNSSDPFDRKGVWGDPVSHIGRIVPISLKGSVCFAWARHFVRRILACVLADSRSARMDAAGGRLFASEGAALHGQFHEADRFVCVRSTG